MAEKYDLPAFFADLQMICDELQLFLPKTGVVLCGICQFIGSLVQYRWDIECI